MLYYFVTETCALTAVSMLTSALPQLKLNVSQTVV